MSRSIVGSAILALGLLCLAAPTSADIEWERQLPLPQGQTLYDIVLVDANTAVAVGQWGTIVRTTDAGATWQVTPLVNGINERLHAVEAAGTRLFVIGYNGVFLRSDDGGDTWVPHANPSGNDPTAITFHDANNGYLAAGNELFQTGSGGLGWLARPLPPAMAGHTYSAVAMASPTQIMAVGDGAALTFDDGATWLDRSAFIARGTDIHFYGAATAVVAYNAYAWLSTDNGMTFTIIGQEPDWGFYTSARALSATTLLFGSKYQQNLHPAGVGQEVQGRIQSTADAGTTWTTDYTTCGIESLDMLGGTVVSAGIGGQVHWSTDDGVSWTQVAGNLDYPGRASQSFLDKDHGVVFDELGTITYDARTNFWRTDDGGQSWSNTFRYENIYDVSWGDASNLYASGVYHQFYGYQAGVVLQSTDGGASWTRIHEVVIDDGGAPTIYAFRGVDVCGTGTGMAVGDSKNLGTGVIVGEVVTISGATVTSQTQPGTGRLNDVSMSDCNNAVAVGDNGTVIVTSDGGASWTPGTSGTTAHLLAVQCVSSTHAFAVGQAGTFLGSTDGGATWTPQSVGTSADINDLSFVDALEGIVVAQSNVYRTADAGLSWTADPVPTGATIRACDYFGGDNMTVTTTGYVETISKRDPTTAVRQRGAAAGLVLEANFPNPFNPSTTIRFVLPATGHVQVAVFDVGGRRVATLVDGVRGAGPHAVQWNGTDHTGRAVGSGVYFYRLETPQGQLSRKMVLIK